jgi:hypothetical protein
MADPHVISALRKKRAELSGDLVAAEKRIVQLRKDIAGIDRTIRVFDPAFAFDLIAEDCDGEQVGAERHVMECEERSACDREILLTGFAAPARSTTGATASPNGRATAVWAIRLAFVVCPAEPDEYPLDLFIALPHDGR